MQIFAQALGRIPSTIHQAVRIWPSEQPPDLMLALSLMHVQVLERVVSFNAQQEAYRLFQSTEEEPADTPLKISPIWEFRFPRAKGKDAMVLRWNPHYHDLLAVGFGE